MIKRQSAPRYAVRVTAANHLPGYGCYGLRFDGLPDAERHLVVVDPAAPALRIERRRAEPDYSDRVEITPDRASVPLSDSGSRVDIDRASATAVLSLRQDYPDEALVHPLLSTTCAIVNWWHGRDAFHAGAYVANEKAWVVIGDKGQGKSTTLAALALAGVPVLSDDVVVVDDGDVLAGPAFVDLRPDAARQLGAGRDMGVLGSRARFRLDVDRPPARVPLGGWVTLAWDDAGTDVSVTSVPLERRFPLLFDNRSLLMRAASPAAFVGYVAKPCYEVRRPRDWAVLPRFTEVLAGLG